MYYAESGRPPRGVVVCITALVIYVPLLFIVVQSFLRAILFRSKSWSLEAFAFILPTRIFIWH